MNNPRDPNKPAEKYYTHQEGIAEDVPRDIPLGWKVRGNLYPNYNGWSESVVTRPADYVPYQTLADPNGGNEYDPARRQYPRGPRDERLSGLPVQRAPDRRRQWDSIRPNPAYHPPGATIHLPYRDDPPTVPPPAPPAGGQNQAAGVMQHNPYPTQRPDVGAGPVTRPAG